MKSAVIFVLIVTVCAKYDIVGKYRVTENTCNQEKLDQVSDFYVGVTANFSPVDDVGAYPFSLTAAETSYYKRNSYTVLDGNRYYAIGSQETDGTTYPETAIFKIEPECDKLTEKSECVSKPECEWAGTDTNGNCQAFSCSYNTDSDCTADNRCYFESNTCHTKYPTCASYADAYSCLHYQGTGGSGNSVTGNCKWVESTKKCSLVAGTQTRDTRGYSTIYGCDWLEEPVDSGASRQVKGQKRVDAQEEDEEEVELASYLWCDVKYGTNQNQMCKFKMVYLGSAQSFFVSLAVVSIALIFVLF